jgi:hypothetical protein
MYIFISIEPPHSPHMALCHFISMMIDNLS